MTSAPTAAAQASDPSPAPTAPLQPSPVRTTPATADRFRCAERLPLPAIDDVVVTRWSPDGRTLAVGWVGTLPSRRTPTGLEEELLFDALDVPTGARRPLGTGSHLEWSASGTYLSYWAIDGEELRIVRSGYLQDAPEATMPEARWVGDTLLFFTKDEIRRWTNGTITTIARVPKDMLPRYPADDVHFSADGERFTLTRQAPAGTIARYIGTTASGQVSGLGAEGATQTEWGPSGHTLLVRYPDRLELRDDDGTRSAPLDRFAGPIHTWAPDGNALLVGRVSPTTPGGDALDPFAVWGSNQASGGAILPNLMGARSFSPSGEYFVGSSRTGLQGTRLAVYRCGGATTPTDPIAGEWRASIATETRRFVRPVAAAVLQGAFGAHTGVDLTAPLGTLVFAADDGVVAAVGWVPAGGQRVCVQHAALIETCYFHLGPTLVTPGERVVRAQPIALVGLTGDTTGPHVHWEARLAGRVVDPLTR